MLILFVEYTINVVIHVCWWDTRTVVVACLLLIFCLLLLLLLLVVFYGYSGLLVGHTNWGETSGRGVFTQLAHRAGLQGSHDGDDGQAMII